MIPDSKRLVVAFSGGKDSTAMALRLHELGERFSFIHTATGNELPDVRTHLDAVVRYVGEDLIDLNAPTLAELIEEKQMIPNFRMRWCTPEIKIEPCLDWLLTNKDVTLCVGLRADEEGRVGGDYGKLCTVRYPLREWDWGLDEVNKYVASRGFIPPARTDCALCFFQTLYEWWSLWTNYPAMYAEGEAWEEEIGHTFRSPSRDTQPASLKLLREKFESGYVPKQRKRATTCRLCSK